MIKALEILFCSKYFNMHMHACSPHVQGSNFFFAGEIVTGGLANFTASWSSNSMVPPVTLVSQSLNLCDIVKKFDVSCPVQSGYYYRNYTNSISLILPAVSHIVHTHIHHVTEEIEACME